MSLKLTKLYNNSHQTLLALKGFKKELTKGSVILMQFLNAYEHMTKILIKVLKTHNELNEIYKDKGGKHG